MNGGHDRNRTGIQGFAVLCVTIPPRGHTFSKVISLISLTCEELFFIIINTEHGYLFRK